MFKLFKSSLILTAIAGATIAAQPAYADTADDFRECRAQLGKQKLLDLSNYRVRFDGVRGNTRGRTVRLRVIPKSKKFGERTRYLCRLEKYQVVAIQNNRREVLYALKK